MAKGSGTTRSTGSGGASAGRSTMEQISIEANIKKAMDFLSVSNSEYSNPDYLSVMKTPKGNWALAYNGSEVSVVGSDQLNEKALRESGKLLRGTPDVFQSKDLAFSYVKNASERLRVMEVGNKYWVVTPADASRLEKGGYKYSRR